MAWNRTEFRGCALQYTEPASGDWKYYYFMFMQQNPQVGRRLQQRL